MAGRFIYVHCMQCAQDALGTETPPPRYKIFNHNSDKKLLVFTCKNGHENILRIDELPFETLLHCAFDDYFNKYYRESVFNFAAALERFFEFSIGAICFDSGSKYEDIMTAWKIVENQSERQLGAFYFIFFQRFNTIPFTEEIYRKKSEIRNSVVHKGKTPSRENTKKYGEFVISCIHETLKVLSENIAPQSITTFKVAKIVDSWASRWPNDKIISATNTISIQDSILSWNLASPRALEQERRLRSFSAKHPKKYVEVVANANHEQKILDVNDAGELILVEVKDSMKKKPTAKYVGEKTFDEYVTITQLKKSLHGEIVDLTHDQVQN